MELLPKPLHRNLNRYWRRRQYRRLDETVRSRKKVQVTQFGGAPIRRNWKIRASRRLRILRLIGTSPLKLWKKFKTAYINMMVNLAGNVGYLNTNNVFGGKRIPKSRPESHKIVYSSDEIERRLVIEIYKALQIVSAHDINHEEVRAV
ncbi:hypothetical protein PanWU01x14_026580 [Parasponia andersonii]|uniref:Uncharacterized protein n=1 Tax=Parasponia andersonii TaxID=3476 RepID=A0A2P5DW27_PARAD|nr:hypothetical protein PanWU01x14_026580 [Parasponia andersonii]